MARDRRIALTAWYALTIVISAFLVFQLQPVISKMILPWFGGSPAVWTTCVLFFQMFLFAGYLYAYLTTRWLRPAWQGMLHIFLVGAALLVTPISPDASWKPIGDEDPTIKILLLLLANVGLPYFILSSTAPLMQSWFSRDFAGRSPYRWYALSNAGSLAALLTYPFIVEPQLGSRHQDMFWTLGFCAFAIACGYLSIRLWRIESASGGANHSPAESADVRETPPSRDLLAAWLALPAFASLMLLATTNHVCQDVASVPFLWVVPLSLYLLTFIICFDSPKWYSRRWCSALAAVFLLASCVLRTVLAWNLPLMVVTYFGALFFLCMLCHGELVRQKPGPRYLTAFYLMCAGGGALGGLIVVLVCPIVFSTYLEMELAVIAGLVLASVLLIVDARQTWLAGVVRWQFFAGYVAAMAIAVAAGTTVGSMPTGSVVTERNFYGVLAVHDEDSDDPQHAGRKLIHGGTVHGFQFLDQAKKSLPATYYCPSSGVGILLRDPYRDPKRIGVIGLGAGALAAYGKEDDYFRFYEINPAVHAVAQRYFTYLTDTPAEVDVVYGDARLSMEREASHQFDVLVLDAFSGDAIPAHLLTREAFEVYLRHVKPDGVIAIHVSNRHLNLKPVVFGLCHYFEMQYEHVTNDPNEELHYAFSDWILASRDAQFFSRYVYRKGQVAERSSSGPLPLWTDQHNNLFEILNVLN